MELPKKIFALIPEAYLKEASESNLEFEASVNIGRCSDNTLAVIITVKDEEGKTMNGWQFISDLTTA